MKCLLVLFVSCIFLFSVACKNVSLFEVKVKVEVEEGTAIATGGQSDDRLPNKSPISSVRAALEERRGLSTPADQPPVNRNKLPLLPFRDPIPGPNRLTTKITDFGTLVNETGAASACATYGKTVETISQKTGSWCWAASAQTIMMFHGADIDQCRLVTKTLLGDRTTADGRPYCCDERNSHTDCDVAEMPHVAFEAAGFTYEYIEHTALSQDDLMLQICANGPFPYVVDREGGGAHTYVVKGYEPEGDGILSVWVYGHGPRKTFELWTYDEFVNGEDDDPYGHVADYVLISPLL
jgi:hypothetical protein